jgi:hypothetical protein
MSCKALLTKKVTRAYLRFLSNANESRLGITRQPLPGIFLLSGACGARLWEPTKTGRNRGTKQALAAHTYGLV